MRKSTSWKKEAVWGEYQKELILPNLLRLVSPQKEETILDLGCGPGLFANEFAKKGARVIGADISPDLIKQAKQNAPRSQFFVSSADNLDFLKNNSVNKIVAVLAIQNIDNVYKVFQECVRVLKPKGKIYLVMNHPAFRVPKASEWGWDPSATLRAGEKGVMYRRIDHYLSESKEKIQMHPSASSGQILKPEDYTISFHRPLQFYFKLFDKNGLAVTRIEEWISRKTSEPGPKAEAENRARKEIPLFLFMEIIKL